jgi:hypothetical protein
MAREARGQKRVARLRVVSPKRPRAQHLRAKPLKVLVGRVGIEPTTNGLRVRRTRAPGARKLKKRNGGFAGARTAAPRPNLCRTREVSLPTRLPKFRLAPTAYWSRRRTVPERALDRQLQLANMRRGRDSLACHALPLIVLRQSS